MAASGDSGHENILKHQAVQALQKDKPQQVVELLKPVAGQAGPDLQLLLGMAYFKIQAPTDRPQKGVPWFRKAAKQGYAQAQQIYGSLLFKGIRVKKDVKRGLYWLRRAALQDDATALYNLGVAYLGGTGEPGVPQDAELGLGLVVRAANRGNEDAQKLLQRFARQAKHQLAKQK